MDLLITNGDTPSVWLVNEKQQASQLYFKGFREHLIYGDTLQIQPINLPGELVEMILLYTFYDYLQTWNFDLCQDLLLVSKSFTSLLYREIYGHTTARPQRLLARLSRTLVVLEKLHDQYMSEPMNIKYSAAKLTSIRSKGSKHHPWDFVHNIEIQPVTGLVVDLTETQIQFNYGALNGEKIWISGSTTNNIFKAQEFKTPVITIMFVDIYDTLIHGEKSFSQNFYRFFDLIHYIYGKTTVLFIMIKDDDDDNPFITRSDVFLQY